MRIALAQINTTVGDIPGNVRKIVDYAQKARAAGAQLVVFPEQCLGGYPALDLWEDSSYVKANQAALKALAGSTGEMALLAGFVASNPSKTGKPIFNAAALLHRGKIAAVRYKSLLPTYDVFDEARYFEPAKTNAPIPFLGRRLGVSLCEDAWHQEGSDRKLYAQDPVREQIKAGADILINLSASPYIRGKSAARFKIMSAHARRARRPFLYCNQIGGNDELIFDGRSFALDGRGRFLAQGKGFREDLLLIDTEKPGGPAAPPLQDIAEVEQALELGIRDYAAKCGFKKVFVGLSGGIDSALVCALAAKALGPENVTGVSMPSPYSSKGSLSDAKTLADNLGVRYLTLPITDLFQSYLKTLGKFLSRREPGLAEQNIQARIRGNLLMALANKEGGLLLSTGNKSEMSVGYCTLYGDMSGGLAVLADVPKMTVYALSRWINRNKTIIPKNSINKAPSAELKPDQKDQDDLPPYAVVDKILSAYVEKREGVEQIVKRGVPRRTVLDILARIDRAEFKRRQAAPCLKISPKAYGVGRRMPIARGSYRA